MTSRRNGDDAAIKCLDLLRLPLALLVTVAQRTQASLAPAPHGAAAGEGEAVPCSNRHAHGALAAQRRREAGRRVEPCHALAMAKEAWEPGLWSSRNCPDSPDRVLTES